MSQELVIRNQTSLFPSESEWKMLKEQAAMVVKTGFLPAAVNTPEKAITIALKGRELGIPPMQAYSHIHIIDGKPTISAELMLSLIYKNCPGAVINYLETSDKVCTIETKRPNHKVTSFTFTIEDARKANLLNKKNWQNYPGAMLRARTVAILARAVYPDAIQGCSYIPEELGADVDDEGKVITIPVSPTESDPKPSAEPSQKPAAATAPPAAQGERDRKTVALEIMEAGAQLGLKKAEIDKWAQDDFGKTAKDLSVAEMETLLGTLQKEIGARGISA